MIEPLAPPPAAKRLAVRVTPAAERRLREGHPWLFENSISNLEELAGGRPGDLAVVFDRKRRFLAIGLFDPDSPIRIKILHPGNPVPINDSWFGDKVKAAAARRAGLNQTATSGFRLVYGEGDGLPAVVIDRYADSLVIKLYSAAWFPYLHLLANTALNLTGGRRLVVRLARHLQGDPERSWGLVDGQLLWGKALSTPVLYRENGLLFTADLRQGHKTGAFFDQRDNRLWVKKTAAGREVLDVFSYAGGFAVHAAAGGAAALTAIDASRPALDLAAAHLRLNIEAGLCPDRPLTLIEGDAFEELSALRENGKRFDMVIVDPPAFAKQLSEVEGALRAYRQLARLALGLLRPYGILVFASCSSRVEAPLFFQTILDEAASLDRPLWVHRRTGHSLDHPVRPTFPEGQYLKCLMASPIDAD